jgi:hypothetical protein
VRSRYLAGVPAAVLPPDAAASVFDTVVRYLREAVRALALAGVIAALGAFLTGPSVTATTIRRWCVGGAAWVKGHLEELGLDLGGVTRWVAPRARLLRGIAVAVAIGFVLLQTYKTPSLILWTTVALLAALALIELLAVEPRRPRSSPAETAPATAAATVPAPARP